MASSSCPLICRGYRRSEGPSVVLNWLLDSLYEDLYKPLWRFFGPRELLALHNSYQSGVVILFFTPNPPHPIFITRHRPRKEFRERVLVSPSDHSCKNAITSKTEILFSHSGSPTLAFLIHSFSYLFCISLLPIYPPSTHLFIHKQTFMLDL